MNASWEPLYTGDKADEILAAVRDIAGALRRPDAARGAREEGGASLAGGAAGEALFHGYLALHTQEEEAAERAGELIDQASEALASRPMSPALYGGFTGVTWAIEHLREHLFTALESDERAAADEPAAEEEDDDPAAEIDEALIGPLSASPWPGDYDLIGGLVGIAVYGLERLPRPTAVQLLERVIERLAERARAIGEGIAWFTDPNLLPEWQRELYPEGYYNLGVAHGNPAVLAVLAACHAAGIARPTVEPLLEGGMRWLLARRNGPEVSSAFGTMYTEKQSEPQPSRLAWCYGDPGVAANLLLCGRFLGRADWESQALEVGLLATQRSYEQSGVRDAGLCHGAAGLAHLFNRMYQITGDATFAAAARSWVEHTLALRTDEGETLAGFRSWSAIGPNMELGWRAEPGFLEGAAGVGLALLGTISSVEPAWDRVLTLSLPGLPQR